jgi:hypothetical protein
MEIKQVITTCLLVALLTPTVQAVRADVPPSIAIIDNGTNPALFPNNIAYEVCLLSSGKCPNGKPSMEGAGASTLPATKNKDFNHGTQMISVALKFNPTAKVIPIRIVGMTAAGNPSIYSLDDVQNALNWIVANRTKYNIAVVSVAQGRVFANCKVPAGMAENIAKLKAVNVPLITAVGNDANRTSVFSPACIPDTVSVGATDNPWPGVQAIEYDKTAAPYIARYSNGAQGQTDFFINPRWIATMLDGSTKFTLGTSNATAVFAGWWLLNRKATFDETYNSLMATTIEAKNEFQTGRYINLP